MSESIEQMNAPRRYIRLEQIHERSNTRQFYDQERLKELAESIRLHGVETDVVLRPARVPGGAVIPGEFEIVTGHRRCRAAKLAGLDEVPARIEDLSDQEVLEKQLVENGQREDISELEEGTAFRRLKEEYGITDAQIAERVGRKEGTVRERRRLASIGPEGRKALEEGKISPQVGLELARIPNAKVQSEATRAVLKGKTRWDFQAARNVTESFTVREARDLIAREYFLDLGKAAFDSSDVTLNPERGACASCPHRSKAQPDMFEDPKGPDLCLDSPCFKLKTEAHWERLKERAKDQGREILPEKKTKEVFEHGQLRYGAPYVELDDACHQDPKGRPYKKLLPKDAPVILARDDRGDIHELVKRDELDELLERAGHDFDDRPTIAGGTLSPAEKKERERQRKQARLVAAAIPRIVQHAEVHLPNEGFWNALLGIYWHLTETIRPVAKRRGFEGAASDAKPWLMKQAKTMKEHQLRGLVLELALTPATEFSNGKITDRFTAAAAAYGVDLKKLGAEVEAEKNGAKSKVVEKAKELGASDDFVRLSREAYREGKDVCCGCGATRKDACMDPKRGGGFVTSGMKNGKYGLPLCSKCSKKGGDQDFRYAATPADRKAWEAVITGKTTAARAPKSGSSAKRKSVDKAPPAEPAADELPPLPQGYSWKLGAARIQKAHAVAAIEDGSGLCGAQLPTMVVRKVTAGDRFCSTCRLKAEAAAEAPAQGELLAETAQDLLDEIAAPAVACPESYCKAAPGKPCVSGSGSKRGVAHATRLKLAEKTKKGAAA